MSKQRRDFTSNGGGVFLERKLAFPIDQDGTDARVIFSADYSVGNRRTCYVGLLYITDDQNDALIGPYISDGQQLKKT